MELANLLYGKQVSSVQQLRNYAKEANLKGGAKLKFSLIKLKYKNRIA
jgi:hypothetical protein